MVDLEELRARVNLIDLVEQTVKLQKAGAQWKGLCPFHPDQNPSLSVSEKFFKCFACGAAGDIVTWVEKTQNVATGDAIRWLAHYASLPTTDDKPTTQPVRTPVPESHKVLNRKLAEQYHAMLPPERRAYYHRRGLNDETIDYYLLGWDGTRYTIPIFINNELVNIRRRRDDDNPQDQRSKILSAPESKATIFNQDCLPGGGNVIIAEGEFDAMLLNQHGWQAVSGTAGCQTFYEAWVPLFAACEIIYICYDNDDEGRRGAAKVAKLIGARARVVTLPPEVGEKGDVTDFFVTLGRSDDDFAALLAAARPYQPPTPVEEPAPCLHLAESAQSDLVGKRVNVHVLVAGKLDAPYIVPRRVHYTCRASEKERQACGATEDNVRCNGYWDVVLTDTTPVFIEMCHKRTEQVGKILRSMSGCPGACKKFTHEIVEYVNVEEILTVPMAERVIQRNNGHSAYDESGHEYVTRNLYLLGAKATLNQYYNVTGRVYPHPTHQLGTILITEQEPMQDNIDRFSLDDEMKEKLKVFQPGPRSLTDHINLLLEDLTLNVTRIYKRDEALLAILLAYHSILNFQFEERPIRRGWLEVLLIGDTGQGKSELVRTLVEFCGLGMFVYGETTSRTGLTYMIKEMGERWFVQWGKYPLNDRRLLAIDELAELDTKDLGQMTQARQEGVLHVDRAGVGEALCRTRIIWMTNPRGRKGIYSFSHGIEALRTLFPADADLRRIDMAVFLAAQDIDLNAVNQIKQRPVQQMITADALKQSILWAWSRKPEDVVIDERSTAAILTEASRLSRTYGAAENIPLVSPADMRNKLARLTVALAAFLHATDEQHQRVIVQPQHVEFIGLYLDSVYKAKNCRYDVYAQYAAQKNRLDETEIETITSDLHKLDEALSDVGVNISDEILQLYRQNDYLTMTELCELQDLDRRSVAKRLRCLQRHSLIVKTKGGYQKTPKFVEYLVRLAEKES